MSLKASCHCGAIQFEVAAPPERVFTCTCSFCSKRGPVWAYYAPDDFTLTAGRGRIGTYQWKSFAVEHHHCPVCGCGTWSDSPEFVDGRPHPERRRVGVNARLFDDFDLEGVPVQVMDGKNLW